VTAALEADSNKGPDAIGGKDGGSDFSVYEIGNNKKLTPAIVEKRGYSSLLKDLIVWLSCDEEESYVCYDLSNAQGLNNGLFLVSKWVSGKVNAGILLDGWDDYLITSNLRSYFTNESVTIEVWFKPFKEGVILDELGQTSINTGWHDSQIEISSSGEVKIRVWNLSPLTIGNALFEEWNHVVLRYNKNTLTLDGFLNGVKSATTISGDRWAPWESNYGLYYAFGAQDSTNLGNGSYFAGIIDEIKIYNRPLSDEEIIYNYQHPGLIYSQTGLIGWWKLDETTGTIAYDSSGNNNTMTLKNFNFTTIPPQRTEGKIGKALTFNGSNNYLFIPVNLNWPEGTIVVLVNSYDFNNRNIFVYTADDGTGTYSHQIGLLSSGKIRAYIYDEDDRSVKKIDTFQLYTSNNWYHLVIVWQNRNYFKLFVNGSIVGQIPLSTAWKGGNKLLLGKNAGIISELTNYFYGLIDDLKIYNQALTEKEIENLYLIDQ